MYPLQIFQVRFCALSTAARKELTKGLREGGRHGHREEAVSHRQQRFRNPQEMRRYLLRPVERIAADYHTTVRPLVHAVPTRSNKSRKTSPLAFIYKHILSQKDF